MLLSSWPRTDTVIIVITLWALIDCLTRPIKSKVGWAAVIVLMPIFGPALYVLLGRYQLQDETAAVVSPVNQTVQGGSPQPHVITLDSLPANNKPTTLWTVGKIVMFTISGAVMAFGLVLIGIFIFVVIAAASCSASGNSKCM